MKVISFNIRCCDDKNGHSVDERAPRLKKLLSEMDADIIGLQEVTPLWFDYHIPNDYGEKYEIFNKYRDLKHREGGTILWKKGKFELIDSGYFWFSPTPWISTLDKDSYKCKRLCNWVILTERESGKRFAFYNMHFGFGEQYQNESVELLYQTVSIIGEKNSIMVGDFNMKPSDSAYKRAASYFDDANALLENDMTTTYHGYGTCSDAHIDYLFLKKDGAKPTAYKLLDQIYDGKYPSDHYGIMFEVELN